MSGPVPFVHSRFTRAPEDHYPTIDGRCVRALLDTWPEIGGRIVDFCAPQGSGIVDELQRLGRDAIGRPELREVTFSQTDWLITNPPYQRGLVDEIAQAAIDRVIAGYVRGAAFLMRANWDMAASRRAMFTPPVYAGQARMCFRPWWSEERDKQPIHNFVWHVWMRWKGEPVLRYWYPASVGNP